MHRLTDMYRPITASPFLCSDAYCELEPSAALKPYIRCFWGTKRPVSKSSAPEDVKSLVIPDTCIDIIFDIDYTNNRKNGFVCTLDEHSYSASAVELSGCGQPLAATFAIRFYAWTAILFAERDFCGCKNMSFPVDEFFSGLRRDLEPLLFDVPTLSGRAAAAERFLLNRLCESRISSALMNVLHLMISSEGRARISDICGYASISEKSLERLFGFNMGLSPKTFSSLIRYQLLWQEMVYEPRFNMLDAAEKFGYCDQPHLLNDFKKRHLMTPKKALEYALKNR